MSLKGHAEFAGLQEEKVDPAVLLAKTGYMSMYVNVCRGAGGQYTSVAAEYVPGVGLLSDDSKAAARHPWPWKKRWCLFRLLCFQYACAVHCPS